MGFSASPATAVQALRSGALTDRGLTPADTVRGARLVVLAGTPAEVISLLPIVAPHLGPEAMLTDLAGAKAGVLAAMRAAGLGARYAGLHPLVSPVGQGFSGARPDLFRGAIVYVTADMEGEAARQAMRAFVSTVLEGEPVVIDADTHDRQVAWTLELPRAAARAVALALSGAGLRGAAFDAAVRSATATAGDADDGWDSRVLANPEAVAAALDTLQSEIARIRGAIQRGDAAALREMSVAAEVLARAVAR